jgi:hypothetical protein
MMKNFLILLPIVASLSIGLANAQYTTTIQVTDLNRPTLETAVNRNISALLSEINAAQAAKRSIKFEKLSMEKDTKELLSTLWAVCPFRCLDDNITEKGLNTTGGQFQVRNIAVMMAPLEGERFDSDKRQELVIYFNSPGIITNLCFTINKLQYVKLMRSSNPVDLYKRQILLDFVENFRTAYNRKDMPYIEKVYSDNALIITGHAIKRAEGITYSYTSQTKKEYLDKLKSVFANNKRINIEFENIKITKDNNKDVYGVTLKQYWNSTGYSDVGYLFLMIDLQDKDEPMIHVRTWQPQDPSLTDSDIFGLSDFKVVVNKL